MPPWPCFPSSSCHTSRVHQDRQAKPTSLAYIPIRILRGLNWNLRRLLHRKYRRFLWSVLFFSFFLLEDSSISQEQKEKEEKNTLYGDLGIHDPIIYLFRSFRSKAPKIRMKLTPRVNFWVIRSKNGLIAEKSERYPQNRNKKKTKTVRTDTSVCKMDSCPQTFRPNCPKFEWEWADPLNMSAGSIGF